MEIVKDHEMQLCFWAIVAGNQDQAIYLKEIRHENMFRKLPLRRFDPIIRAMHGIDACLRVRTMIKTRSMRILQGVPEQ